MVTASIIAHALLGFLSQASLAASQGAGNALDAYFAGAALPTAIVAIMATALSGVVIPALAHRSVAPARRLERELVGLLVCVGIAIGTLGAGATLLAPGYLFSGSASRIAVAATVAPWFWLACGTGFVVQLLTAVENSRREFTIPAAVSILLPLSVVTAAVLWGRKYGPATIAASYASASLVQAAVLWTFGRARPRIARPSRAAVAVFSSAVPVALAVLPNTFTAVSDAYWSGFLPAGTLSYFGVANRITIAIAGLVVTGMAVTSFPEMADLAAAGRHEDVRAFVAELVMRAAAWLIPIAAVGVALRVPGICAVFRRGSFSVRDCVTVANILPFYLAGMVGMAVGNLNSRVFYAMRDTRTPAIIGMAAIVLYTLLSGIAALTHHVDGIPAAFTITWLAIVTAQLVLLRTRIGSVVGHHSARTILGLLGTAVLVALGAYAVGRRLDPAATGRSRLLLEVVATGAVALAAYVAISARVLRVRIR